MLSVGMELTISAGERPQTDALDRAATGTGIEHVWYQWSEKELEAANVQIWNHLSDGNVGYSENKNRLRIFLAHPRDRHFTHVQWLPLSIEKPQKSFREIRVMFMFVPMR